MDDEIKLLKKFFGFLAAYFIIGMLVYGHGMNHAPMPTVCIYNCELEMSMRQRDIVFRGVLWPFALSADTAIWVTRWP